MRIVGEVSCNHLGSLVKAKRIIEEAARAGATAVKLQYWTPGRMVPQDGERAPSPWQDMSLWALYERAHTPAAWFWELAPLIHEYGMEAWVSPFDGPALAFLEHIGGWDGYKIASPEANDLRLIQAVGKTGKPVVISSGCVGPRATLDACQVALNAGAKWAMPCWCVSKYPARPEEACLRTAVQMFRPLAAGWGLSDHTTGIGTTLAAVTLGASYIERHLMLPGDEDKSPDGSFSLVPAEFALMVGACKQAQRALGGAYSPPDGSEMIRRVYARVDLESGSQVGPHNLTTMRGRSGIGAEHLTSLYGARVTRSIKAGEVIHTGDVNA